jgi:Multicopper oxidase
MPTRTISPFWIMTLLLCVATATVEAQSFRVQCPTQTITHPNAANNNSEPVYSGATAFTTGTDGYLKPVPSTVNGAIKCQQISGGDGFATMGDGTQTYMFSFGPLSGLADIANGLPGTQFPEVFNTVYDPTPNNAWAMPGVKTYPATGPLLAGDPATTDGASDAGAYSAGNPSLFTYNGAIGQVPDQFTENIDSSSNLVNGHVDPRPIMDVGVMNGNIPAPLMAIDEDDEFFLTLTNVGMIMRPDLFEQHTVHFHGYPNASSFFDGVPDASVAINIGGSFTYYYLAPDAGTYFWHCHITPPEHLQMGMVGQVYVRPRQNRVTGSLYDGLVAQQADPRTACRRSGDNVMPTVSSATDILCTNPLPAVNTLATGGGKYAYNDGDGSTRYDVEYPLQIHGFDPNFHFVGMTFNPEGFADMKDKYFLLNGRSYPDTVTPGPLATQSADGSMHYAQPLPSIINIPAGGRALLRISDLDVSEFQTLASLGIPMQVIAINAKLLRDQAGNNMYYDTNSITLGGGESLDVILDATDTSKYQAGQVFYLYTPNLDHLSNDAENFGGLMTEIHIN